MSLNESLDYLVCPTMPNNWLSVSRGLCFMAHNCISEEFGQCPSNELGLASRQDESYRRDPPLADFGNILFNIPAEWRTFREKPG